MLITGIYGKSSEIEMKTSMTYLTLTRCIMGATLLGTTVSSFANTYAQPAQSSVGRAAIWTADEAESYLSSDGIPANARVITVQNPPSTPAYTQPTATTSTTSNTIPSRYNNVGTSTNTSTTPIQTNSNTVPSSYNNTSNTVPSSYNNTYNASGYNNTTPSYPNTTANYNYTSSNSSYQPTVNARAALVLDANTGEVLYSKNTTAVRPIASITKVMTAMVTMDANLDMNERITLVSSDFAGAGGKNSSSTLRSGDTMTRAEALLFALMKSENPAAMALARTYPGGRSAFVSAMNSKARSLGMTTARFADPSGLDVRNVASARDLAMMVSAAAKYPTISYYSTTASHHFDLGYRTLLSNNTNALVRNGGWHMQLSKTGYIRESGRCVVMQTNINSRPTIVVLLGSSDSATRTNDATKLFNWVAQLPQPL